MTNEEMRLDMLVAELDYENRLLRARNDRVERCLEGLLPYLESCDLEVSPQALQRVKEYLEQHKA